jgi:hypothetical protein
LFGLPKALVKESLQSISGQTSTCDDHDVFMEEMQHITKIILNPEYVNKESKSKHDVSFESRNTLNQSLRDSFEWTPAHPFLMPHQPEMVTAPPTNRLERLQTLKDLRELHAESFRQLGCPLSKAEPVPSGPSRTEGLNLKASASEKVATSMRGEVFQSLDFSGGKGRIWQDGE